MNFKPSREQIAAWVEANFTYKSRKNGDELLICNPFDGDTKYHFNISTELALCHDFRSDEWAQGAPKTFLRFVQLCKNCSFADAVKKVCGNSVTIESIYSKIKNDKKVARQEEKLDISLPPGSELLISNKDTHLGKMLVSWLASRGISEDVVEQRKLHFHSACVVWPYYEYENLVYWQERSRINKIFRFPPESVGVTKGMFLYGFDLVEPGDYVVVTEAIFDSLTLGSQCVATGGAIITENQVLRMRALNPANGVILAPDNDKAGLKSLISNYKLLNPYFKLYYAIPPKIEYEEDGAKNVTKDWNELGKVMPWSNIRSVFEKTIKSFTLADMASLAIN